MLDLAVAFNSPCHSPFELSDYQERVYRKELIYVGTFHKNGVRWEVTEDLLHHWAKTHGEFLASGIEVPLPIEHTRNPEARRGTVTKLEVAKNSRGLPALFGYVKFRDAEAEKLASTTNVSIYVPPEFTDGNGRTYYRPLCHVALTDYPVVPGLDKFQAIAASLVGEMKMSLATLAEKLGIPVADQDEAHLEAQILMAYSGMKEKLAKLEGDQAAPEGGDAPADKPKGDAPPIAAGFVNLLRKNRTMELDSLQHAGLLTPAARKTIEASYLTEKSLTLSLSSTDGADDGFDGLVKTLRENGRVILLGEKSRAQAMTMSGKDGTTVLVADAKRRAEQAKARR